MKPIFKSPQEERSFSFFKGNFLKQVKKLSKVANNFENAVSFYFDLNAQYNDSPDKTYCLMVFGRLTGWRSYVKKSVADQSKQSVSGLCYAAPAENGNHIELFIYCEKGKTKKQFKKIRKSFKEVVPLAKLQLRFVDATGSVDPKSENLEDTNTTSDEDIQLDEVNDYTSETNDYDNTIEKEALQTEKIALENLQNTLKANAQSIATELKELVAKLKANTIRPKKVRSILKDIEKDVDRKLAQGVDYTIDKAAEQVKKLAAKFNKDIQEIRDYLNNLDLDKEEDKDLKKELKSELKDQGIEKTKLAIEGEFNNNHNQFQADLKRLKAIYETLNATK